MYLEFITAYSAHKSSNGHQHQQQQQQIELYVLQWQWLAILAILGIHGTYAATPPKKLVGDCRQSYCHC